MRPLTDLIHPTEPAMPLIRSWLAEAACPVEVLPCSPEDGDRALLAAQVTTRSPLGAICHVTGGILVDHGWLRILGAGCARLPRALMEWNAGRVPSSADGRPLILLVADDVLGGFFAVNGGGIPAIAPGNAVYLAPDTLRWQDLGMGYSDFLCWSWSGRLAGFYGDQRWPGWQDEVTGIDGARAFSFYPFLWAKGPAIGERSRKAVPISELWSVMLDMRRQIDGRGLCDA